MNADTITLILVISCVPAANLYPLIYMFRPWRSTPQGQALFIKSLGNVVLIDMSFAFVWLGDYPGREVVRVVGFTLFAIGINYLLWTLITSPGARRYPPFSWRRHDTESD